MIPQSFFIELEETKKKSSIYEKWGNAPQYELIDNRFLEMIETLESFENYWKTHANNEGLD